eukprot:CAMPEP_0185750870 /NCGR_PEP_ID=MMETSP1174-20130828/9620_1 /TAXON_ID=35687 /ORGANISM="Dictyocha speculum, Strain CCMP1381" /LENGTH=288 /DNA_ID=CAMNT_0028427571 /DNA_START=128 /DNA_END=995 /DNA_ORIENTATION=+
MLQSQTRKCVEIKEKKDFVTVSFERENSSYETVQDADDSLFQNNDRGQIGLQLQLHYSFEATRQFYTVSFSERRLGMSLKENETGQAIVKATNHTSPSENKGVKVESAIIAINGVKVSSLAFEKTKEMVQRASRPVKILFENVSRKPDALCGICYILKTNRARNKFSKIKFPSFKSVYFVLGGALAKPNVLQFYRSKSGYEDAVQRIKVDLIDRSFDMIAYEISSRYKCGPCRSKQFNDHLKTRNTWFPLRDKKNTLNELLIAGNDADLISDFNTKSIILSPLDSMGT